MAFVRLKGLNRVRKTLKDGSVVVHYYAWKGGPKIATAASPGSPEFMAAYNAAIATARPQPKDTLAGLVARYRASPEYLKNADTTKRQWGPWLDRVAADKHELDIGALSLKALDDRRVREDLLDWRDQWAATPRTADYAMQVLSRVLSWAKDRGILAFNHAQGVGHLYQSNRADMIWTEDELARFARAAPSPEVGFIPALAALTGLRREDLTKLAKNHVGQVAIVMKTGKSRGRRTITIPILPELKTLLARIAAQQALRHAQLCEAARKKRKPEPPVPTTILSNTRGRPWTVNGLEHQVIDTKTKAGITDKILHDTRGSFATRLRKASLKASQIADVLGWEEERVERLLRTYVDQDAIVTAIAAQIAKAEEESGR